MRGNKLPTSWLLFIHGDDSAKEAAEFYHKLMYLKKQIHKTTYNSTIVSDKNDLLQIIFEPQSRLQFYLIFVFQYRYMSLWTHPPPPQLSYSLPIGETRLKWLQCLSKILLNCLSSWESRRELSRYQHYALSSLLMLTSLIRPATFQSSSYLIILTKLGGPSSRRNPLLKSLGIRWEMG